MCHAMQGSARGDARGDAPHRASHGASYGAVTQGTTVHCTVQCTEQCVGRASAWHLIVHHTTDQAPLVETDNSGTLVLDVANWLASFGDAQRRAAEFAPPPMPPPTQAPPPPPPPARAADLHDWEVVGGATSREIRLGPAPREVELRSSSWFEGSEAHPAVQRAWPEARGERASSGARPALGKAVPRGAAGVERSNPLREASQAVGAPPPAADNGEEAARRGTSIPRRILKRKDSSRIFKRKSDVHGVLPQHALARSPGKKIGPVNRCVA